MKAKVYFIKATFRLFEVEINLSICGRKAAWGSYIKATDLQIICLGDYLHICGQKDAWGNYY